MEKKELKNMFHAIQQLAQEHPDIALEQAKVAMEIAKMENDIVYQKYFLFQIGVAYFNKGEYDLALVAYQNSLEIAKQQTDNEFIAKNLIKIGAVFHQKKDFKAALVYYLESLQYGIEEHNGVIYNNLASIYYEQAEYDKSIEYLEQSISFAYKFNRYEEVAGMLINLSIIESEQKMFEKAILRCEEAYALAQNYHFKRIEIYALINKANIEFKQGLFEKAKENYNKAKTVANENSYVYETLLAQKRIAQMTSKLGCPKTAIKQYEALLENLEHDENHVLYKGLLESMIEAYQSVKDYKMMSETQTKLILLQKKIIQTQQNQEIKNLLKNKEKEIDLLKIKQDEIKQKNEMLSELAYIVAHDLKEPLRVITSFVNLLQKRFTHEDEVIKEYMNFVVQGTTKMNNQLSDLLLYVSFEREEYPKELTNLNYLISQVLINLKETIKENQAEIFFETLPTVEANAYQITLLFQNLLQNSIKFRKLDKNPVIHISVTENEKEYLFAIKDNGIGIEAAYQQQIFKIFKRLDKTKDGTGIGLPLCQKIVQSHNGKIWLESAYKEWTTIYFTLPKW